LQGVIDAARRRLTQYANDGMAHYALGLSYVHLNLIEEGLAELRKAADLLPEKAAIRYEASAISVRHRLNSYEALNQLNVVLSRQPDFKQALYLRGIVLEQQGKMGYAVKDWQSAYQIDSQYMPVVKRLADFIATERQSLAISSLNEANLDQASGAYLRFLTMPMPPSPLPLGETSMDLLRLLSEKTAQRMQKMHAEKVREYEATLNERNNVLQEMESDLIGLSSLCLASFEARQHRQIQQSISTRPLTIQERSAILDRVIRGYQKSGYRLLSRTETTAQLYRPKQFSCCIAVIMVFLVIGIILYLLYYLTKKDETVYLEVDQYGRVKTTQS
jgi:tetratricopeptide (TPR) repeat protein